MEDINKRLESFSDYPGYGQELRLAHAGFFYTGKSFACSCYRCGITIVFAAYEDPWIRHLKHSPLCGHIKKSKEAHWIKANFPGVVLSRHEDFLNIRGAPTTNQYEAWQAFQELYGIPRNTDIVDSPMQMRFNEETFAAWQVTATADQLIDDYCLDKKIKTFEDRYNTFVEHCKDDRLYYNDRLCYYEEAHNGMVFSKELNAVVCNYCGVTIHTSNCRFVEAKEEESGNRRRQGLRFC
jgi:hypothetical protein